jgi:hypothetical protein
MFLMSIDEAIQIFKEEGSHLRDPTYADGVEPMVYQCTFAEKGAKPEDIDSLPGTCPVHLKRFWQIAQWARLFEDVTYGQWGLRILTPSEASEETCKLFGSRRKHCVAGDLVVGKFLGDSELVLVRCDHKAADFGKVLIVGPIDPRKEWFIVGDSFEDFLGKYLEARGEMFWWYQKNANDSDRQL